MIMRGEKGCLKGMVELYEQSGGNVIAVEECAPDQAHKYGIVGVGDKVGDGFRITKMVEKPPQGTAPSNFFINGRYILQPEIFSILETQERGAGNEIQLTDGMLKLLEVPGFRGLSCSAARPTTAAPRMASFSRTSPSRLSAPTSARPSRPVEGAACEGLR